MAEKTTTNTTTTTEMTETSSEMKLKSATSATSEMGGVNTMRARIANSKPVVSLSWSKPLATKSSTSNNRSGGDNNIKSSRNGGVRVINHLNPLAIKSATATTPTGGRHLSYDNTSSYQIISTDNHHHHLGAAAATAAALLYMEPCKKSHTFVCGVNGDEEAEGDDERRLGASKILLLNGTGPAHRMSQVSQYLQPDKSLAMYEDSTFNNSVSHTRASYAFSENDEDDDEDEEDSENDNEDDDDNENEEREEDDPMIGEYAESSTVIVVVPPSASSLSVPGSKKTSLPQQQQQDTVVVKKISFKEKSKLSF